MFSSKAIPIIPFFWKEQAKTAYANIYKPFLHIFCKKHVYNSFKPSFAYWIISLSKRFNLAIFSKKTKLNHFMTKLNYPSIQRWAKKNSIHRWFDFLISHKNAFSLIFVACLWDSSSSLQKKSHRVALVSEAWWVLLCLLPNNLARKPPTLVVRMNGFFS